MRQRAEKALLDMVPDKLMRCGLTCDFTMECLTFLRKNFDIQDPDPAMVRGVLQVFHQRMSNLFCKGLILGSSASCTDSTSSNAEEKTASQIVFEQVDFPEPMLGWI